jgi:hypothetical protein
MLGQGGLVKNPEEGAMCGCVGRGDGNGPVGGFAAWVKAHMGEPLALAG